MSVYERGIGNWTRDRLALAGSGLLVVMVLSALLGWWQAPGESARAMLGQGLQTVLKQGMLQIPALWAIVGIIRASALAGHPLYRCGQGRLISYDPGWLERFGFPLLTVMAFLGASAAASAAPVADRHQAFGQAYQILLCAAIVYLARRVRQHRRGRPLPARRLGSPLTGNEMEQHGNGT
jgi:hypothetical protein